MQNFINYITYTNNITLEEITKSSIKEIINYVRYTLNHINNKSYEIVIIRKRREEIRNDIEDLERAYVNADSLEINESGANNGLKTNKVELRKIKILELREQLGELINKTMLMEKSLVKNKNEVINVFDKTLGENQSTVMKLYYIDCWSISKIAVELYYSRDTIRQIRNRSIKTISEVIYNFLRKK